MPIIFVIAAIIVVVCGVFFLWGALKLAIAILNKTEMPKDALIMIGVACIVFFLGMIIYKQINAFIMPTGTDSYFGQWVDNLLKEITSGSLIQFK